MSKTVASTITLVSTGPILNNPPTLAPRRMPSLPLLELYTALNCSVICRLSQIGGDFCLLSILVFVLVFTRRHGIGTSMPMNMLTYVLGRVFGKT